MVHEDLEKAQAWSKMVTLTIVPLKGGIQYEPGADAERVARAEKNMAYQAVAACRQHAAINRFDYAKAVFRMGEGRKECERGQVSRSDQ